MEQKSDKKDLTDKELLELGKKLQDFYNLGYVTKKQAISFAFLKGIAYGLGLIIGSTVIIALLVWFLGQFNQVPLIGHFVENLKNTIDSAPK